MNEPLQDTLRSLIAPFPPASPHGLTLFLRAVQARFNWLPPDALQLACDHFQKPYTQVYETAAFTPGFSLEPRGRHVIKVCHGLACREVHSQDILKEYCRLLGVKVDEVSEDGEFTVVSTPCLGQCAMGPNMVVDGRYLNGQSVVDCLRNISELRKST